MKLGTQYFPSMASFITTVTAEAPHCNYVKSINLTSYRMLNLRAESIPTPAIKKTRGRMCAVFKVTVAMLCCQ